MPIYEYECRACGRQFEIIVLPASAAPACPECQGQDLERLLSAFAVSSEETRQTHLKAARRRMANSADVKDKQRAEAEDVMEHMIETGYDPKRASVVPKPTS